MKDKVIASANPTGAVHIKTWLERIVKQARPAPVPADLVPENLYYLKIISNSSESSAKFFRSDEFIETRVKNLHQLQTEQTFRRFQTCQDKIRWETTALYNRKQRNRLKQKPRNPTNRNQKQKSIRSFFSSRK